MKTALIVLCFVGAALAGEGWKEVMEACKGDKETFFQCMSDNGVDVKGVMEVMKDGDKKKAFFGAVKQCFDGSECDLPFGGHKGRGHGGRGRAEFKAIKDCMQEKLCALDGLSDCIAAASSEEAEDDGECSLGSKSGSGSGSGSHGDGHMGGKHHGKHGGLMGFKKMYMKVKESCSEEQFNTLKACGEAAFKQVTGMEISFDQVKQAVCTCKDDSNLSDECKAAKESMKEMFAGKKAEIQAKCECKQQYKSDIESAWAECTAANGQEGKEMPGKFANMLNKDCSTIGDHNMMADFCEQ